MTDLPCTQIIETPNMRKKKHVSRKTSVKKQSQQYLMAAQKLYDTNTLIKVNDVWLNKYECCVAAIKIDETNVRAYLELAHCIQKDEHVVLNDTKIDKTNLICKALVLNPKCAEAYYQLAQCIPHNGKIKLFGKKMNRSCMYIHSILHDPNHIDAYMALADLLKKKNTTVEIYDQCLTKLDLYLTVIKISPNHARAYLQLAKLITSQQDTIEIDEKAYNQRDLLLKSIHCQKDDDCEALYLLATKLNTQTETVHIKGISMNVMSIYTLILTIDKTHVNAYKNMLKLMDENARVEIEDQSFTKHDLRLKIKSLKKK